MNSLLVIFAACVALSSAVHQRAVLQGPGSHAAVIGPDGSHITASEQGGAVVADVAQGYAAHGYAAHAVPVGYAAHGYAAHAVPVGYAAHGLPVAHALPLAHGLPVAHHVLGYEGQYVPSGLERLYDDGSYRGEHHYAEHLQHYY